MLLPSLPDGSNWNSPWQLDKESRTPSHHSLPGHIGSFSKDSDILIGALTAVHLVTGVLAVHLLVTLAGVGDAASVSALELISCAQRGW